MYIWAMTTNSPPLAQNSTDPVPSSKTLSAAAQRALAEADQRRVERETIEARGERDGPSGVEPTRYGDWERKGIAYDF